MLLTASCASSEPARANAGLASAVPEISATPEVSASAPPAAKSAREAPRDDGRPPASRYAALTSDACLAELARRAITADPAPEAAGDVVTPMRLKGKLHGIAVTGIGLATSSGKPSPYSIADCRLLVALDDLAAWLAARDVVELQHMSMYRPSARKPDKKPSQHQRGLAIDLGAVVTAQGERLVVLEQWTARLGQEPCPPPDEPKLLRLLPCAMHDHRLFHVIVTPYANPQHRDHLHLDLTEQADWFVID